MSSAAARRPLGLVLCLAVLLACQLAPLPTSQTRTKVESITAGEPVVDQIVQTESFDQCDSESGFKFKAFFGAGGSEEDLVFISPASGTEIPAEVRADLEAALAIRFPPIPNQNDAGQGGVSIDVPAHTRKDYTMTWRETRQQGTITYTANGQTASAGFSYRNGLELLSAEGREVECSAPTATATDPIIQSTSTPQPGSLSDGCISAATWKPDSVDPGLLVALPVNSAGCYDLASLGLLSDQSNLHIRAQTENNTLASGIYTPISPSSVIEFKIFVNSLYATYKGDQPEIVFAVTPANDRLTAKTSTRFKLHVEDPGSKPVIHFMLADAGENSGALLGTQHYEYGRVYNIRLQLNGNQMDVFINDRKMNESLILPEGERAFYIGYQLPILSGADVEISDIQIDGVEK